MPIAEVKVALRAAKFKPNCGTVIVDFLLRHGLLTTDNDEDIEEIARRLRRKLMVAGPVEIRNS